MPCFMDSDWFAGFTAGEGCFAIRSSRDRGFCPCFQLNLRADDLAILEQLRAEFGGTISVTKGRVPDKPAAFWNVSAKKDLARIVAYFDRYDLRAKKAQDYVIWRRAVEAYMRGGWKAPELPLLRDALRAGRAFDADGQIDVPEEPPQLRLVNFD